MTTCEVAHRVDGPDAAPPVVLSNSLGTTWRIWDAQLPALSATNKVVRYDHRGHGASPTPPGPYSIAGMGSDVIALLDRLEIESTSFVGVSLGGMVGMWLAARHPERFGRLVLICTSAFPGADAAWQQRATLVEAAGTAVVAEAVVGRWFTPGFARREPELISQMTTMISATPAAGYAACCRAIAGLDLRTACQRITAPALVVSGAEDPAMPPAQHGRVVADLIPGAGYLELSPAAHLANVEQAAVVTDLLLDHLSASGSRADGGMQA